MDWDLSLVRPVVGFLEGLGCLGRAVEADFRWGFGAGGREVDGVVVVVVVGGASVVVGEEALVGGLCRGAESLSGSDCTGKGGRGTVAVGGSRLKDRSFSGFCFRAVSAGEGRSGEDSPPDLCLFLREDSSVFARADVVSRVGGHGTSPCG